MATTPKKQKTPKIKIYEIDFEGQMKVKMMVAGNQISINSAIDGYGNPISFGDIKIKEC